MFQKGGAKCGLNGISKRMAGRFQGDDKVWVSENRTEDGDNVKFTPDYKEFTVEVWDMPNLGAALGFVRFILDDNVTTLNIESAFEIPPGKVIGKCYAFPHTDSSGRPTCDAYLILMKK